MKIDILIILCSIFAVCIVALVSFVVYMRLSKSRNSIIKKALSDARRIKMDAIAEARIDLAKLKGDADYEIEAQLNNIELAKNDLNRKRENFFRDLEDLGQRENKVLEQEKTNTALQRQMQNKIHELNQRMADFANMPLEELKSTLNENIKKEIQDELMNFFKAESEACNADIQEKATATLLAALEKNVPQIVSSNTVTRIPITEADMKGKIIGKEGRNIKAFEQYGGVDIIVDDVPNSIAISTFNPIRREIAARALKFLMEDGRIQPVKIEEALIEEERKLNQIIEETGNEVALELGVYDFPDEVKLHLGKLKFRTSYNQNVLQHSIEVAKIASRLAGELGLDQMLALKSGLLHDIGKAVDYEQDGSHVSLGVKLLKKHSFDPLIINAVEAHHGDVPRESVYAALVAIADTASAARPGARNNNFEDFFVRMDEIERSVKAINGVKNAYILQAGRQIRVMVNPDLVNDYQLMEMGKKIRSVIEKENKTPGEIVITVIREQRTVTKINSSNN